MMPPWHDVLGGAGIDDLAADIGRHPDLVDLHFVGRVDLHFGHFGEVTLSG